MRMTAEVRNGGPAIKRVMIHEDDGGCYVFHYTQAEDGPCDWDTWHESLCDALSACAEQYGILEADWAPIPDAEAGCQHDVIRPTEITHDAQGDTMNTCRFVLFALAAAFGAFSASLHAQTPASNPPGACQPLSPTAVTVGTLGCKTVPGNLVGQYVSKNGTVYVVETRRGRIIVNRWALLGLPYIPPHPGRGRQALANVHPFH